MFTLQRTPYTKQVITESDQTGLVGGGEPLGIAETTHGETGQDGDTWRNGETIDNMTATIGETWINGVTSGQSESGGGDMASVPAKCPANVSPMDDTAPSGPEIRSHVEAPTITSDRRPKRNGKRRVGCVESAYAHESDWDDNASNVTTPTTEKDGITCNTSVFFGAMQE